MGGKTQLTWENRIKLLGVLVSRHSYNCLSVFCGNRHKRVYPIDKMHIDWFNQPNHWGTKKDTISTRFTFVKAKEVTYFASQSEERNTTKEGGSTLPIHLSCSGSQKRSDGESSKTLYKPTITRRSKPI